MDILRGFTTGDLLVVVIALGWAIWLYPTNQNGALIMLGVGALLLYLGYEPPEPDDSGASSSTDTDGGSAFVPDGDG